MNSGNLKFISSNVKGIQESEKRTKIFEYLRNSISSNGFILLQETRSPDDNEKRWCNELNSNLYFCHRKINSYGVTIGYVGSKSFVLANQTTDKNRCLLLKLIIIFILFSIICIK